MPLYKTKTLLDGSFLLVWKVTESYEDLYAAVTLTEESEFRLQAMKSSSHRKAFLAVRKLLQTLNYTDFDLFYEVDGKPYLLDDHHVSITHSFDFVAVIISEYPCGIDMEMARDKIIRIADKFINEEKEVIEAQSIKEHIQKLTLIWAVKESVYKLAGQPGLSFKDDIVVAIFSLNQEKITVEAKINGQLKQFKSDFELIESFVLTYIIAVI